jgi:DNA-binding transcriptional MocR family regulator
MKSVTGGRLALLLGPDVLSTSPAYLALAGGIRHVITDGRVSPGTRLPSERELTAALGTSRTTVTGAYRELKERGYLVARQGSGSVASLPGGGGEVAQRALIPRSADPDAIDLTCATSQAAPGVAAAFASALEVLPRWLTTGGYDAAGLEELRVAIASRYTERGLPTGPGEIVVTTGAAAALAVVLRALIRTGDRMLFETPTYPNAVDTAMHTGARLTAYPLDPEGWDLDLLDATLRQTAPRVAFLIPDFHNPTGLMMSGADREVAARVLRRQRTTTIVDETMVDIALTDEPVPAPFAAYLDEAITIGSMSKAYWGGLRVGWIRAPQALVTPLVESRATFDLSTPVLEQLASARLLERREQILPEWLGRLRERRDTLVDGLRAELPDWEVPSPAGGLSLWCRLPERISTRLVATGERHGVLLAAGPRFGIEGGFEQYLRIPFGSEPDVLRAAAPRIAAAYDEAFTSTAEARTTRRPLIA